MGDSESMVTLRGDILWVVDLEVPVLFRGEFGIGKEFVVCGIHVVSY